MDSILNILIVLGFVGFAIFRQVLKPAENQSENTTPVPFGMDEAFPELDPETAPVSPPPPVAKTSKTVNRYSKRTSTESKPREVIQSPLKEEDVVNSDIDTQSIEGIRKGIIWSEILNRKY